MDHREFKSLLAQGKLPSVLLFEGEEDYLKQEAWQSLRRAVLPAGMEALNETVLETVPDTDTLIAAAETMPFMADRRLIQVQDHPALFGKAEPDDTLLAYLPRVPASALVVFYCTRKPDSRKKLYAAVKKLGGIVTFAPLRDRELTAFVTGAFSRLGRQCDERTADYLIFTVGSDTTLLLNEISKIASHREGAPVDPDEIASLATPSVECTVFQMVDAVVAGQEARALLLFRNLVRSGVDRVFILAMLLRQFRLLQHVRIMQFEKQSTAAIRSALGVPSFAADQYIRQAGGYSGGQIRRAVDICFSTENGIKSGLLNADGSVESALLKILNLRKPS